MRLLKKQQIAADDHFDTTIFLEGPAGMGKTTAAIERVKNLIRSGARAESILVLVPQAALALPYREALRRSRVKSGGSVQTATLGSLAQHMVGLFWPVIAEDVGFEHPLDTPHFLSLEMVQYYMTRFIEPEIRQRDLFNSVHISRSRLYTQIVDNLNKAALVGFSHETIGERLKAAWAGEVEQAFIYDDAQISASLFRELCRRCNLLDFSLQVTLFVDMLWKMEQPRRYLTRRYRHLIVDNLEEDTPATHDLLLEWLPVCESALLIYDSGAGYRRFLGADPDNAYRLKTLCRVQVELDNHRVMSPEVAAFQIEMARSLDRPLAVKPPVDADPRAAIVYDPNIRYQPQMIEWAAAQIAQLVHEQGVPPDEIVVLAAFLPDALRFGLQTRLDALGIPNRAHRPSRALRDEPAARALLALAKLAHPQWGLPPGLFDLTYALSAAIADLDPVRARLLVDGLYQPATGHLLPFDDLARTDDQSRITYELGARYEKLRQWIETYQQGELLPLDLFWSRLFGEVLSQPKFGFHRAFAAASVAANLIDSARDFRQTASRVEPELATDSEYVKMVDAGVIANQYLRDWEGGKTPAVLLAPAYTFLMSNQPVDYQFWLNIGSAGWGQRLYQPLTQPYVMSRQWPPGRVWSDVDEYETNQDALASLALGLTRRCRKRIYLGFSQVGEQGYEQRGPLLMAVQTMLRRLSRETAHV